MSVLPQQRPKQQHFVHRAYLEGFVDPDCEKLGESYLWAYLPGKTAFRQRPERIAKRNYYYCFKRGNTRSFDVEHMLQRLEDASLPILKRLRSGNFDLDLEERLTFAGYVALSCTRVPTFEQSINRSVLLKQAFEIEEFASDPEKLKAFALEESESAGKPVSPEEVRRRMTAGNVFLTQTNRGWSLGQMAQAMMPLQRRIFEMCWVFLIAPEPPGFVTSDNPVSLFTWSPNDVPDIGFLDEPNASLAFPLSRDTCLVAKRKDGPPKRFLRASAAQVRAVNRVTISRAEQQLYAPFESRKVQGLHDAAVANRGKPKRVMIKKGRVVEE